MNEIAELRIRSTNNVEAVASRDYVLYWMIAYRRSRQNFSLQRAVYWAKQLNKPLLILEALRCDYPWASDRLHRFIIEGMQANAAQFARKPVSYYPYIEPEREAGKGLLKNSPVVLVSWSAMTFQRSSCRE